MFIGWGQSPSYSEYASDGSLLYAASLPAQDASYGALRLRWEGLPLTRPSAVAVREGPRTTVYLSWNGATQVEYWQVYAGASAERLRAASGLAFAQRTGFQTTIPVSVSGPVFEVEALAADNRVLGVSMPVQPESSPPAAQ